MTKVRVDKWLWSVRIFKTRTQATNACKSGKIKIDEQNLKPSFLIQGSEILSVKKEGFNLSFKVVKLIFNYVDEKNPVSDGGSTPLHYAAQGGYLNVCKLIMANNDDIAHKNLFGTTAMDLAMFHNHIYVIQLFRLAAI